MKLINLAMVAGAAFGVAGCEGIGPTGPDKSVDRGFNSHSVSNMKAGIWVDPNGCDHWIIDDGIEGYLSERLTPDGRPVCSGVAPPNTATGPFKKSGSISDIL